eukprot:m.402215 g.402215  ORF g.402215 m.402215 type:complete len:286 (+) comp21175_c1_seq2:225-1082(+)
MGFEDWVFGRRWKTRGSSDVGAAVVKLLSSKQWQILSGTKRQDVEKKFSLMSAAKIPPMRVLAASVLHELGRIPHSTECKTVLASEVLDEYPVFIFVSHRWLRPKEGYPDDSSNSKARALAEWGRWYETIYIKSGIRKVFFWLDWPSMDQTDVIPHIQSLPLYVATCNDFLCFETHDYNTRAWCSVERAIAYAFMFSGKIPWVIRGSFELKPGEKPKPQREEMYLPDPREGQLSFEADRKHIMHLMDIAQTSKAWTGGDGRKLNLADKSACRVDAMVLGSHPPAL